MKKEFSLKFSFLFPVLFSVTCNFDCFVLHVQLMFLILLIFSGGLLLTQSFAGVKGHKKQTLHVVKLDIAKLLLV